MMRLDLQVRVDSRTGRVDRRRRRSSPNRTPALRSSAKCLARRSPKLPEITLAGSARRSEAPVALADLLRRLHRPPAQPAEADHAGQRRPARRAVDVPGRRHGDRPRLRGHAADDGRRALHHRQQQHGVGDRRAHRPAALALPPRAAARPDLRRRPTRRTAASPRSATCSTWARSTRTCSRSIATPARSSGTRSMDDYKARPRRHRRRRSSSRTR